jgi:hypothetical protein
MIRSSSRLSKSPSSYHHVALNPVILAPDQAAVFPLPQKFVRPQDGQPKQDGALNAGARWLYRWGRPVSA